MDEYRELLKSPSVMAPNPPGSPKVALPASNVPQEATDPRDDPAEKGEEGEEEVSVVIPSPSGEAPTSSAYRSSRWAKLRGTIQVANAVAPVHKRRPKNGQLTREDSFLRKFSTRHGGGSPYGYISDRSTGGGNTDHEDGGDTGDYQTDVEDSAEDEAKKRRREARFVVDPDENFMFYWLGINTAAVLYNLWTCIAREAFPEIHDGYEGFWFAADGCSDLIYLLDICIQMRTGYLEQGLIVYNSLKLARHYVYSRAFLFDIFSLLPLDFIQIYVGIHPLLRFPRFLKSYRLYRFIYLVETRTAYPNMWRVANLSHVLFLGSHWFAAFYFLISKAENFETSWGYPKPVGNFSSVTQKYLRSLYWSTLTLTTIGDLQPPDTNWEHVFTIVSYLIGVFVFATIVGQVGNVITNRNASRQEFERLLDGAKAYMRNHNVPQDMQRHVQRWYDYAWLRGRMNGGGDINALGLLPDKLKTELALHVNLETLKKVTIFQECEPEFLHDLVLKMKTFIFTPGDLICRQGEVAREMFIIADGLLEVISDAGEILSQMKAGDFFGEIGILNLDGGVNRRTADVRSVGYSELIVLSRNDVLSALKDHPEAEVLIKRYGQQRLKELGAHKRKRLNHRLFKEVVNGEEGACMQHMIESSAGLIKTVLNRAASRMTENNPLKALQTNQLNKLETKENLPNGETNRFEKKNVKTSSRISSKPQPQPKISPNLSGPRRHSANDRPSPRSSSARRSPVSRSLKVPKSNGSPSQLDPSPNLSRFPNNLAPCNSELQGSNRRNLLRMPHIDYTCSSPPELSDDDQASGRRMVKTATCSTLLSPDQGEVTNSILRDKELVKNEGKDSTVIDMGSDPEVVPNISVNGTKQIADDFIDDNREMTHSIEMSHLDSDCHIRTSEHNRDFLRIPSDINEQQAPRTRSSSFGEKCDLKGKNRSKDTKRKSAQHRKVSCTNDMLFQNQAYRERNFDELCLRKVCSAVELKSDLDSDLKTSTDDHDDGDDQNTAGSRRPKSTKKLKPRRTSRLNVAHDTLPRRRRSKEMAPDASSRFSSHSTDEETTSPCRASKKDEDNFIFPEDLEDIESATSAIEQLLQSVVNARRVRYVERIRQLEEEREEKDREIARLIHILNSRRRESTGPMQTSMI